MGRGRAKAKQTKVARELKYSSPGMDLDRLSKDLHNDTPVGERGATSADDADWGDGDEDSAAS